MPSDNGRNASLPRRVEVALPLERVDAPLEDGLTWPARTIDRRADLGDELRAQRLLLGLDGGVQLLEAALRNAWFVDQSVSSKARRAVWVPRTRPAG